MKQVKVFVEDVAQHMGLDQTVNEWLESMSDMIEVDSIQLSMGATPVGGENPSAWPVAILVVYRPRQ